MVGLKDVLREHATPTQRTYREFNSAYAFFNTRLFDGSLPDCLITIQRKNKAYGYFAFERFGSADDQDITDEIALNPHHFKDRSAEEVLSTLVHEMVHLWQFHFGKPSRSGYHNKEWAAKMETVGLIPTDTGAEGGKKTGQNMSHYIAQDGLFAMACADLIKGGFSIPYVDRWDNDSTRKKKSASKTKFNCAACGQNAWAKADAALVCGYCAEIMEPQV